MATVRTNTGSARMLAEVLAPVPGVPLDRIRVNPALGRATVQDVIDIYDRDGVLCELVAGVLVEKPVGYSKSPIRQFFRVRLSAGRSSRNNITSGENR